MPHDRSHILDALRGSAILWMTGYHLCFDLNYFGWIRQNFYADPVWTWQRTAIVSLFLLCAGLGQALAARRGQGWPRFWRRWAQIAGCALLVTAGSYWMFPRSFIYFGVLHGIALMLVIARLTTGWGGWLWPSGALAVAAPWAAAWAHDQGFLGEAFNGPLLNWLGLISHKPRTEDYVPLLPWLGVMWWGVAAGQWLARRKSASFPLALPAAAAPLAWLGRWSLTWYMLHQPVMLGVLMAAALSR